MPRVEEVDLRVARDLYTVDETAVVGEEEEWYDDADDDDACRDVKGREADDQTIVVGEEMISVEERCREAGKEDVDRLTTVVDANRRDAVAVVVKGGSVVEDPTTDDESNP